MKRARLKDVLIAAEQAGLLKEIVNENSARPDAGSAGQEDKSAYRIKRDTDLIEVALANLAVSDDYLEWLRSHKGAVSKDVDLEF